MCALTIRDMLSIVPGHYVSKPKRKVLTLVRFTF